MATSKEISALATTLGLKAINTNTTLVMNATADKGACEITLKDTNCQCTAVLVQKAITAGNAFDKAICFGLNYLYMQNAHKGADYKTFASFGEALTGKNKDTVNAYRAIGEIFLDTQGNALRPYIDALSIAHLNQLKSFFGGASVYHCGAKVDHDFLDALLSLYPRISVSALRELIKTLKDGQLASDKVDTIVDADGETHYYIKGSQIELKQYDPKLEKDSQDGKDGKDLQDGKDGKDGKEKDGKEVPKKDPYIMLADAVTALENTTMDEKTLKDWEKLSKSIMAFVNAHIPTDVQDGK